MWAGFWELILAYVSLERVVAVEVPLKVCQDDWYPPLAMSEKLSIVWLWWRGLVSTWRVWWLFLETARRWPMQILTITVSISLACVWFSVMASGAVGVALATALLLVTFRQIQRYRPSSTLQCTVNPNPTIGTTPPSPRSSWQQGRSSCWGATHS